VDGLATDFLYDGLMTVQELAGGTPFANLLNGAAIDEMLMRTDAMGTRVPLPDALGSTLALTDSTGTIKTQYTYEPFGTVTTSGESSWNSTTFTGREADGTGLYYYRARYYDPTLQRFISRDPLAEWAGVNFYSYVGNKPTLYIDPTGLLELCCRPVNMPGLRQAGAQHCFIKLSDGTTLGSYNRNWRLRPEKNAPDDKCPKDKPDCKPLPGNEDDVRKAWDKLPKDARLYGWDGTSNRVPAEVLDSAGIPYTMPPGAIGTGPIPPVIVIPMPGGGVLTFPRR
jgi:RHS repeat-associated protein